MPWLELMKAMVLDRIVSLVDDEAPLELREVPKPALRPGEVLLRVLACGVCHTELDEIEGRTPPPRLPVIPGHQVIGVVEDVGPGVEHHALGERLGVGWIYQSSGDDHENLSAEFRATGRDANGGYAEFMTVPSGYAYPIPPGYSPTEAAPLLCAGAVGYRALKLTQLRDGESLGLMGFGGSARLVLQTARHLYPNSRIFAFARDEGTRRFALELGVDWAGDIAEVPPEPLAAIIDTTPAWKPVVESLAKLSPAGRLVINAIRKEETDKHELLKLDYARHLWMEREVRSVANVTHRDIAEFLTIAGQASFRPEVESYRLEEANQALVELKRGSVRGSKVLVME